jgi:hypothetical protein
MVDPLGKFPGKIRTGTNGKANEPIICWRRCKKASSTTTSEFSRNFQAHLRGFSVDCRFIANSDFEDFTVETSESNLETPGTARMTGMGIQRYSPLVSMVFREWPSEFQGDQSTVGW